MDKRDSDGIYTFLGLRPDGVIPVVDVRACPDDAVALLTARRWLGEHASCTAVEVWRGGEFIGSLGASPLAYGERGPTAKPRPPAA